MKTYEIIAFTDYLDFHNKLNFILTSEQKAKNNQLYCFRNKKHFLDNLTYSCDRGDVEDASFNIYANKELIRQCYCGDAIVDRPITTPSMYNLITSQQITNRCYWYAIKILNNGQHENTVFIMALKDGSYYHTYGGDNHKDCWPDEIPEEYKSQIIYKPMVPFIADEINDSNIELHDNKIFVEGKEINMYGYYANKDDMFKFNYSYTSPKLYIHVPFNTLNLKYCEKEIMYYIGKYTFSLNIEVIDDNTQLRNITHTRIGGIGICEKWLDFFDNKQQPYIIRQPQSYNVNMLYRWRTEIYNLNT